MISKRKLMAYRRAALALQAQSCKNEKQPFAPIRPIVTLTEQILELTQELIDQHLLIEEQTSKNKANQPYQEKVRS